MITSHIKPLVGLLVVLLVQSAIGADVKITFMVKVPATTPEDARVYMAGDAEALGAWKADGVEMEREEDGTYSLSVALPKDKPIEYKITRGSWETVEKNADGSEMDNRTFTPTREAKVEVKVAAWADQGAAKPEEKPAEKKSTRTGDIREHPRFHSRNLNNDRDVLVWLPPGYDIDADRRYPVLYMHDGQNLFDEATSFAGEWRADETAGRLVVDGKIEPIIIVAIANTPRRMDEYTLTRDAKHNGGSSGKAYIAFVAEELKPFIDATYRTKTQREHTGVGGSSLGAVISLEICRAHPNLFGKCIAMSPALWWADGELIRRLQRENEWMKDCRIWVDIGTEEGSADERQKYIDRVSALRAMRDKAGISKANFHVGLSYGQKHNEHAWAQRFGHVLMFLFPA